jgi:hypothetical protein
LVRAVHLLAITLSDPSSALISIYPGGTLTTLQEVNPVRSWLGMETLAGHSQLDGDIAESSISFE